MPPTSTTACPVQRKAPSLLPSPWDHYCQSKERAIRLSPWPSLEIAASCAYFGSGMVGVRDTHTALYIDVGSISAEVTICRETRAALLSSLNV